MKTTVIARLQVEGIHQWKDCPLPEVEFLRYPHRHIFHINCEKEVFHDNRDVEFIMMKREILKYLNTQYQGIPADKGCLKFNNMSCEMIAQELLDKFKLVSCEVFEDNENGARVVG